MDELWKDMGRTDAPPAVDVRAVKARVNAALDADPTERKVYMRQKTRLALVAAAIAVAVTGSAWAVTANLDALQAYFQGDTTPAQSYLDSTPRSVSDGSYTLTVESSAADENTAYLVVTVKANNEESKKALFADGFEGMDTFSIRAVETEASSAGSGEAPSVHSFGTKELTGRRAEDSRSWQADASLSGPAAALRVRLGYMEEGKAIEVPMTPAPSVTVEVSATGIGLKDLYATTPGTLTVERVILTPLSCKIATADEPTTYSYGASPRVFFRMADGSIRTQSQMMWETDSHTVGEETQPQGPEESALASVEHNYRFYQIQDLAQIASVIVFDREYPLDGSSPKALAHDPALDPIQVPATDALTEGGGYSLPVRALTEGLGGTCHWDAATGDVTCVYRGVTVVLAPGSDTATVDGAPVALTETPVAQNGVLAANHQLFFDAWGLDGFVLRTGRGDDIVWGDWYIIP